MENIKVYFETNGHADHVATFHDDEAYAKACRLPLETVARSLGYNKVTESVTDGIRNWGVRDVLDHYECDEDVAEEIMDKVLNCERVGEIINEMIAAEATIRGLESKEDDNG